MHIAQLVPADFARHLRTGRQLQRAQREAADDDRLLTATPLDDLVGGLERGALTEVVGRAGSGRFSLVLSALAAVTGAGEAAALVDLGDGLDPRLAERVGVDLARLLWARPRTIKEALAATEAILDVAMPLVVLELGLPPVAGGRGAEAFWLRLGRAAEARRVALFVSAPYRVSGTAARVVLETWRPRAAWLGRGLEPRLIDGLTGRLEVAKNVGRPHHESIADLPLRAPSAVARAAAEDATSESTTDASSTAADVVDLREARRRAIARATA
ncbi:MAG: hypothetical protein AAGN46_13080 [Acidobacteriota bacterium]